METVSSCDSHMMPPKHTGQRMTIDKIGLYTVQGGKIVKEEFFYSM
jgi:hypothetical protein